MARITLAAATLAPGQGGIASVARMSRRALEMAGHDVAASSYLDDATTAQVTRARSAKGSKLHFAAAMQFAALRSDILLFDSAGIARARPRLVPLRRPFAVWMHGIEAWEAIRPDAAEAFRSANLVLVNSQYTLNRFEHAHGPLPHAKVCWLATEANDPPMQRPDFAGPPVVLILARIVEGEGYKGHDALIGAWPAVVARIPGARLVIAGGGSALVALRGLAARSPATASIDVLGFVPEKDLEALWRQAHVFAMPSKGEGFGLAYVEAMCHGLPVIASRHDAGQEVNSDGVTGYNVALDQPGELESRLIALLSDHSQARAFGEAARARWHSHFRFDGFCQRFNAIFSQLISEATGPA